MLDPSPNYSYPWECLEIWDNHGWYVPSKVVLNPVPVYLEVRPVRLRNSRRLDHEVHLIHLFELFGDHPRSSDHNFNVSKPNRSCVRVRWADDQAFRTQDYKANWSLQKVIPRSLNDSTGSSKSGKERFQEFYNNSGIIGGERFCFNPFRQVVYGHENVFVPSRRRERAIRRKTCANPNLLNDFEERREIALIKEAHYKQKLEGYYNKRVRPSTFKPGTYELRFNSASKEEFQGKMGPTWEGPYIVKNVTTAT
ncbi:hypothetical protein Tco_0344835 [Tanacetum coccineum]